MGVRMPFLRTNGVHLGAGHVKMGAQARADLGEPTG
jgi:hypothetical protein